MVALHLQSLKDHALRGGLGELVEALWARGISCSRYDLVAPAAHVHPAHPAAYGRQLRRTADVCGLNARRITRGDRDALEAIQQWHTATA